MSEDNIQISCIKDSDEYEFVGFRVYMENKYSETLIYFSSLLFFFL